MRDGCGKRCKGERFTGVRWDAGKLAEGMEVEARDEGRGIPRVN